MLHLLTHGQYCIVSESEHVYPHSSRASSMIRKSGWARTLRVRASTTDQASAEFSSYEHIKAYACIDTHARHYHHHQVNHCQQVHCHTVIALNTTKQPRCQQENHQAHSKHYSLQQKHARHVEQQHSATKQNNVLQQLEAAGVIAARPTSSLWDLTEKF